MNMLKWIITGLITLAGLYGGLAALGVWRWSEATRALVQRLDATSVPRRTRRYGEHEIADLPTPVRRYFELVLTDGQPMIRAADIALEGTINMSLEAPQWKPFTSEQHVVTNRPGFIWNAKIMLFPDFPVRVHDAYVAGEGILRPSMLGLFSLGAVQSTGEPARGELMRWLAESVWYPTALLPEQGVEWQAVDATSAQATLSDGSVRVTMLFRFGEDGLVCGIHVEARGGLTDGKTVMMPWEGQFGDYRRQSGMMIPYYGEVAWITPQGERPYFRGSLMQVTYRLAE